MTGKGVRKRAQGIEGELIQWRRYLHEHAETGFDLEKTTRFICSRLQEFGYTPKACGKSGVVATVGKASLNGKAFLLRADTDALPIKEQTRDKFACKTGNMHACGHDIHTAMLLGAAKLLKEEESALLGTVKLLFQPAEEILQGAKAAISAGALETPEVKGAMMLHVTTASDLPSGSIVVSSAGVSAPAADYFTIQVRGKSCHGSTPHLGIDALTAAAHVLLGLQEISARELSVEDDCMLTVGKLQAGKAGNAIPDLAILQGTLRAYDEEVRGMLKTRIQEIAKSISRAFRAKVKTTFEGGCPTLVNDENISNLSLRAAQELFGKTSVFTTIELGGGKPARGGGSEDFAYISQQTPSVMVALCAGNKKEGYIYPLHHPKARFDESVMKVGCALMAYTAFKRFAR